MGRLHLHVLGLACIGLASSLVFGPVQTLVALAMVVVVAFVVALATVVIDAHVADRERVVVGEPRQPGCRHVCDLTCTRRHRTVTR